MNNPESGRRHLVCHVTFQSTAYHGCRKGELEWPPSPGRLHQALLATACRGGAVGKEPREAVRALKWLEQLGPPVIEVFNNGLQVNSFTGRKLPMPFNNKAKNNPDWFSQQRLLLPESRVEFGGEGARLRYIWSGIDRDEIFVHGKVLTNLAGAVPYLGRSEDIAVLEMKVEEQRLENKNWTIYAPSNNGLSEPKFPIPVPGSTAGLVQRYAENNGPLRPVPAESCMAQIHYANRTPNNRQPVINRLATIHLPDEKDGGNERQMIKEAIFSSEPRAAIRHAMLQMAKEMEWDDREFVLELISGHQADNSPAKIPHLAVTPLPSLSTRGQADGLVRKFAIIGYAPPGKNNQAQDIYQRLFQVTNGYRMKDKERFPGAHLEITSTSGDKLWSLFSKKSRHWVTALPIGISRRFDVPRFTADRKPLDSNRRYLIRQRELDRLIRDSLRQVEIPEELVETCELSLTASPFLRGTQRAEQYRLEKGKCYRIHAQLSFSQSIQGPLLIGDRRYQGFGLCLPLESR